MSDLSIIGSWSALLYGVCWSALLYSVSDFLAQNHQETGCGQIALFRAQKSDLTTVTIILV